MDIVSKSTGDSLSATEFNQIPNEIENALSSTGQSPSAGDLFQLAKAIVDYAAHGDFYTDSGSASTYVLGAQGSKQAPTAYADGMRIRFVAGNTNTGVSTVNVAALGVKDIKDIDGYALVAGEILTGAEIELSYDSGVGEFRIANGIPAGSTVQMVNTQDGLVDTGSTVLPFDDSIPQNTEGDEYMTLAITPKSATNKLKIDVTLVFSNSAANSVLGVALFKDSTADALAATYTSKTSGGQSSTVNFSFIMAAGTITSTTFKVRAGGHLAGTTTINGTVGGQIYDGVMASNIIITEFKA